MKRTACLVALWLAFAASDGVAQHHGVGAMGDRARDPSTAALLSIQPLPVDAGSFYAGNWGRGILYTAAELALLVPAAVVLERNGWWRGMHGSSAYFGAENRPAWTSADRDQVTALLAGYIVVKVISAFDAGYSAERRNRSIALRYDPGGRAMILSLSVPLERW